MEPSVLDSVRRSFDGHSSGRVWNSSLTDGGDPTAADAHLVAVEEGGHRTDFLVAQMHPGAHPPDRQELQYPR